MASLLYVHEVVDFAIKRKRKSFDHYSVLTKELLHFPIINTLQQIIQREKKHTDFYNKLFLELTSRGVPAQYENENYSAYVDHLIDSHRTVQLLPRTKLCNSQTVVNHVSLYDKDSIRFYEVLRYFVDSESHSVIDTMIANELRDIID